jgi:hypothetical protein
MPLPESTRLVPEQTQLAVLVKKAPLPSVTGVEIDSGHSTEPVESTGPVGPAAGVTLTEDEAALVPIALVAVTEQA